MAERGQVFRCNVCGHMIEIVHEGSGTLVCCGEDMELLKENTTDAAKEKHVPVIEKVEGGYLVKVGSVAHPMEEKHYIEWIELQCGKSVYRKYLKPGDKPEARFSCPDGCKEVSAREYCNLHGLWKGK